MKKIIGLTVAALMVMGLVGGGTWAYFADPESATGNVFQAGTIDLHVDSNPAWSGTIGWTDAIAGAQDSVTFENAGTINGVLYFSSDGTSTDGISTPSDADDSTKDSDGDFEFSSTNSTGYEMSAQQYAQLIEVTDGGAGFISTVTDSNGDGMISLYELQQYVTSGLRSYNLNASSSITFTFQLFHTFDDGAGAAYSDNMTDYETNGGTYELWGTTGSPTAALWNIPQADGCSVDISVTLKQD